MRVARLGAPCYKQRAVVGSSAGSSKRQRFDLDVQAEREGVALRAGGACVVLLASAWLLALPYPLLRVLSFAGFAFGAFWLRAAVQARARLKRDADHFLELGPDALRLSEGDRVQVLPWQEIVSVSVDEDRLRVSIARRSGPCLEIEPRYVRAGSEGLHDLAEAIHAAHQRACPKPRGAA